MIVDTDKHGALQRLAGAVLIQARKDFDTGSGAKRPEVEDWVCNRTKGQMSFELCCQLLELDPDYTRKRLFGRQLEYSGTLRRSSAHRTKKAKLACEEEATPK
jgi:hypothetical protein